MAKQFSALKGHLGIDSSDDEWSPVRTYRDMRLRIARRNLRRKDHQVILEPLRALRFLRDYQDTGRSRAELSDIFCLTMLGLIEIRGARTLLTTAGRQVLEETKSWPHMRLIRGSSSPHRLG